MCAHLTCETPQCVRASLLSPVHAQVALVRLCYGEASLEMVQAIADLAEGYAKEDLWPQVRGRWGLCMPYLLDVLASQATNKKHAIRVKHVHKTIEVVACVYVKTGLIISGRYIPFLLLYLLLLLW